MAWAGHVGVDLDGLLVAYECTLSKKEETYTAVRPVGASATLGSLVDLDALDDQVAGVETLGVGVGFGVLEQVEDVLDGLDGPAGLGHTVNLGCRRLSAPSIRNRNERATAAIDPKGSQVKSEPVELDANSSNRQRNENASKSQYAGRLTLSRPANVTRISSERNGLLVVQDVLEVRIGALQLHAIDGLGGLARVLEADTQVRAPGAGALRGRNVLSGVADLRKRFKMLARECLTNPNRSDIVV